MINSMTAFAREVDETGAGSLAVEIRSVNHRYLDCLFKLPEALRGLEPAWRQLLQQSLSRGKLECQVRWQANQGDSGDLQIDSERLRQLVAATELVKQSLPDCRPPTTLAVMQWPGVVASNGLDEEALHARATALFKKALGSLAETRAREGGKLAEFIRERLQRVHVEVDATRALMPELLKQQRQRLEQRLADVSVDADPGRLEQELVLMAHRADVEEELDRLQTHVGEVERVLAKGGACGRRLDFLMQELNREANTLSSKSIAGSTTQNAVELKVLIEQMREQIQNLE
jgi:uncharacterized protein (TIGR00255 family)